MPDHVSQPLPPYRGILAVDTERFSRNPSVLKPDLSAAVQDVLRRTADACGQSDLWKRRRFPQSAGDGYLMGVQPHAIPFLIHPFLDSLHEILIREDQRLRTIDRSLRLRFRVSIDVGPVPDSGDELHDRVGTPTDTTCRLLDSKVLRNVLRESNPDVTLMAAIISQRVFRDVVQGGYTALHADQFESVTAEVPDKDFAEAAWLYTPRPSRGARSTSDPTSAPPDSTATTGPVYHSRGQQINAEQIHGGVSYKGRHG